MNGAVKAGLLGLLALSGCASEPENPQAMSQQTYLSSIAHAEELSRRPFERFDRGVPLSEDDLKKVREAKAVFQKLIAARPQVFANYFGAGKALQIMGEHEQAAAHFQKCLERIPSSESSPEVEALGAEAFYLRSVSLEILQRYTEAFDCAITACSMQPENPNYWAQSASVRIQAGDTKNAASDLQRALDIDPNHPRARQLKALLNASDSN